MIKKITKIFALAFLVFSLSPITTSARENVDYWYLKNFDQKITVADSNLIVEENITADCGNASGKHGIFRALPTRYFLSAEEPVLTPVYISSLTDFNGNPVQYQEILDNTNYTITWRIGDPNRTVKGIQNYRIKYTVVNAIRFGNPDFDEFYWNLNGNFWDIETDAFSSTIIFPENFNHTQSQVSLYSGEIKDNSNNLATDKWLDSHTIQVQSKQTLKTKEGITLSVTLPKNLLHQIPLSEADQAYYQSTGSTENFPNLFGKLSLVSFIIAPIVLIFCLIYWAKYGRDPKIPKTIVPEFEIPENLAPIEMALIQKDGKLAKEAITAAVINLAVKGYLTIEETTDKKLLFKQKDYLLKLTEADQSKLMNSERLLLNKIFGIDKEIKLSDLKNEFYTEIKSLADKGNQFLDEKKWLLPESRKFNKVFLTLAFISLILTFSVSIFGPWLFISTIILFIFAYLIRKRSPEGLKLLYRIEGFKLYMKTAEKYRQQFNEKENIFEKYLPYAILFGLTGLWIKKMKELYGEEYFNHYHPVWFVSPSFASFNVDSFNTAITSLSTDMSQTMASSPSSSGAGGGGFSGGGGGGGGGGGW